MEERLDVYVANNFDISRTKAKKLIEEKKVLVNGYLESPSYKVKEEDDIEVIDELNYDIKIEKENIPLDIVYEDEYLLIINKKSGMVVHPAPGNYSGTLVNALLYKFDLEKVGEKFRPGIVHRISPKSRTPTPTCSTPSAVRNPKCRSAPSSPASSSSTCSTGAPTSRSSSARSARRASPKARRASCSAVS